MLSDLFFFTLKNGYSEVAVFSTLEKAQRKMKGKLQKYSNYIIFTKFSYNYAQTTINFDETSFIFEFASVFETKNGVDRFRITNNFPNET